MTALTLCASSVGRVQDALSRCERRNGKLKLELEELTDMTKV